LRAPSKKIPILGFSLVEKDQMYEEHLPPPLPLNYIFASGNKVIFEIMIY
jgi:hypothetical protein